MDPAAPEPQTSSLRYTESLRVAWLMVWRALVLILLVSILLMPVLSLALTGILTTIGIPGPAVNFILSLIPVLILPALIQPILFVMALNKEYRGFHIEAIRPDGVHEDLTLTEAILPALMIWVISTVISFPILIAIRLLTVPSLGERFQLFVAAPLVQVAFALPMALWLVFRFHRARFHSFRFNAVRESMEPEGA